ncbi:UDP-N-acetylmuramoyl-tripeptide--D-alanyl-D-alanine ligase [Chungangia koreensis]|uniref:UDP-N-acetylmuramoyl-tripeptide--D-alanyl-D-alanine ligase n=1 Tax=Chungangia koreensis TaxID=752657 RepID=A0ABV8X3P9_9LACT
MKKQLRTIADWLNVETQGLREVEVSGVSINTRTLQPGDLFIPFRGEKVNGHDYVMTALENGAAASLWQADEPNPPKDVPLLFVTDPELALQEMARKYREELDTVFIGITGSNGKTSTKDLVAGVLSPYFKVQKTEGNFNNQLGLPLTILSLDEETEYAVLEMGMSGFGEIEFLTKMAKPKYAVITNIGEAHMQDLGSREGIAKAKFEIVQGLLPEGMLFYDGDEPLLVPHAATLSGDRKTAFGYGEENALSVQGIRSTERGSEFTVSGLLNESFTIPVLGSHQVKNSLAAILIGMAAGLNAEQIRYSLQSVKLTDMRMQVQTANNDAIFINDAYNAAPASMKAALSFLKETEMREEKWAVLGDMLELGDLERQFHEEVADDLTPEVIKGVCLYGPRMEWLYEKLKGKFDPECLIWSKDEYDPLIEWLSVRLNSKSVVLLKGSRGMALENILKAFV